eukprot:7644263-Prorocentrum_lima.AAC.1
MTTAVAARRWPSPFRRGRHLRAPLPRTTAMHQPTPLPLLRIGQRCGDNVLLHPELLHRLCRPLARGYHR